MTVKGPNLDARFLSAFRGGKHMGAHADKALPQDRAALNFFAFVSVPADATRPRAIFARRR